VGEYNRPFSAERFSALHTRILGFMQGRDVFVQDCHAGADPDYRLPIRLSPRRRGTACSRATCS